MEHAGRGIPRRAGFGGRGVGIAPLESRAVQFLNNVKKSLFDNRYHSKPDKQSNFLSTRLLKENRLAATSSSKSEAPS